MTAKSGKARTDALSVAEIAAAIEETEERVTRKRADLAERRQRAEALRDEIGVLVADDGDPSTLRRELRNADDDCDSLERAITKLGKDLMALQEHLAAAQKREATDVAQRAREDLVAVVDDVDRKMSAFLVNVFLPLDAKHTALARAANQAKFAVDQAQGIVGGMSAAERVWVEKRHAVEGSIGLQKVMDELRGYAKIRGLDVRPE